MIDNKIIKFLRKPEVKTLLADNKISEVYAKCTVGRSKLTQAFIDGCKINPLEYMTAIPHFSGGKLTVPGGYMKNYDGDTCEVIIPEGFEFIDHSAFERCTPNIKVIHIPHSACYFGVQCFYANSDLTIHYNGTKKEFRSINKGKYCFSNTSNVNVICTDDTITYNNDMFRGW
jgi:hypothetical protein